MLSKAGDGWIAEVEVNGFGLRLVCIETGAGIAVNVYSNKDQRWADVPVWVRTFDEGKNIDVNSTESSHCPWQFETCKRGVEEARNSRRTVVELTEI